MDFNALKRGLAKVAGAALSSQAESKGGDNKRKYNLNIIIPIKAPNKRLVQDQCKLARQRVESISATLVAALGVDPRVEVDGDINVDVKSRE